MATTSTLEGILRAYPGDVAVSAAHLWDLQHPDDLQLLVASISCYM